MFVTNLFECFVQIVYQVGGNEAMLPQFACRQVAAHGMQPYTQQGGILWGIALCQKAKDDAREHIAAACRAHAVVAIGALVLGGRIAGYGDGGGMTL